MKFSIVLALTAGLAAGLAVPVPEPTLKNHQEKLNDEVQIGHDLSNDIVCPKGHRYVPSEKTCVSLVNTEHLLDIEPEEPEWEMFNEREHESEEPEWEMVNTDRREYESESHFVHKPSDFDP